MIGLLNNRYIVYMVLKMLSIIMLKLFVKWVPTQEIFDENKLSNLSLALSVLIFDLYAIHKNEQNMFVILMRSLVTGLSKEIVLQQTRALYILAKIFHLPLAFFINWAMMSFYKIVLQYILMLTVSDYVDASATIPFLSFSQIDQIESEQELYTISTVQVYWIMLYVSLDTTFKMYKDGILELLKKWYNNFEYP